MAEARTTTTAQQAPRHGLRTRELLQRALIVDDDESALQGGPPTSFSSQLHGQVIPSLLPNGEVRLQNTTVSCTSDADDGRIGLLVADDVTELTQRRPELLACRHG